jgi:hypothetical protein
MHLTAKEALESLSFGQRVAEEEVKDLAKYFVETEQWRRISSGEVDVVYGPKGAGKSALYALLLERADTFFDHGIVMVSGESPRGATVFKDLIDDPPTSEREFVNLWKLYFLSLVGSVLNEYASNDAAKIVISALTEAHLLSANRQGGLKALLRSVVDYVRRMPASFETEVKLDPTTGTPVGLGGKITFHEPQLEDAKLGRISVDSLFDAAEEALAQLPLTVWILMDRLDVAFAESAGLEANALRALFKVYLDLLGKEHIKLKIFLRTDIWRRITGEQGFREASHITKHITIKWDRPSLTNLAVRRAVQSEVLMRYVGLDADSALGEKQSEFLDKLFPDQVEVGPNKPRTFDWILGRTADGSGQNAPRELIHFLNSARNEEIRRLELGSMDAESETVFSRPAIKNALPEVSKVRLEQTLYAEYPDLRPLVIKLEREKTLQKPASLATLWQVGEPKAIAIAEQLVEVGFFQRRGSKEAPEYWVPFLYRSALSMVQGSAEVQDQDND